MLLNLRLHHICVLGHFRGMASPPAEEKNEPSSAISFFFFCWGLYAAGPWKLVRSCNPSGPLFYCTTVLVVHKFLFISKLKCLLCQFMPVVSVPHHAPQWKAWLYLLDDLPVGTGGLLLGDPEAVSSPEWTTLTLSTSPHWVSACPSPWPSWWPSPGLTPVYQQPSRTRRHKSGCSILM